MIIPQLTFYKTKSEVKYNAGSYDGKKLRKAYRLSVGLNQAYVQVGELPCDKQGSVYLIDVGAADAIIKERMAMAQAEKESLRQAKQRRSRVRTRSYGNGQEFDFVTALKAL